MYSTTIYICKTRNTSTIVKGLRSIPRRCTLVVFSCAKVVYSKDRSCIDILDSCFCQRFRETRVAKRLACCAPHQLPLKKPSKVRCAPLVSWLLL